MIALTPAMVTTKYQQVNLQDWTTSGIGPIINYFFLPTSIDEVRQAIEFVRANNLNCYFLGGGSNTIFNENINQESAVICFKHLVGIERNKSELTVQAGTDLQEVVDYAQAQGLAGIVGLNRIPGTIGGATVGNAGAYGTEMSQLISKVTCLNIVTNTIVTYDNLGCEYAYRESIFKHTQELIVLSVTIELEPTTNFSPFMQYLRGIVAFLFPIKYSTYQSLEARYLEIATFRDKIYPKGFRSPGSTFKNLIASQLTPEQIQSLPPESIIVKHDRVPVAKLLEAVGSKGLLIGGVRMRLSHANIMEFVSDTAFLNAFTLVDSLRTKVLDRFGIRIEPEIRLVNEFNPLPLQTQRPLTSHLSEKHEDLTEASTFITK
jgi:UDP-N-acetylmuramate dehydrogenase